MVYKKLKKILLKITPIKLKTFFGAEAIIDFKKIQEFSQMSYAQEGEDLILNRFFNNKKTGFYIDVGAHHPKRYSNTFSFYKKGWRGINIDAMPGSMSSFNKQRPEDINIEVGVSKTEQVLTYYIFNELALNTFSESEAKKKDGLRSYKIIDKKKVETFTLKQLLDLHLKDGVSIDFLTIDVEGLDLEVIESNDWEVFRPKLVLVEDLKQHTLSQLPINSKLYKIMLGYDYELVAKTFNTLFFKDKRV